MDEKRPLPPGQTETRKFPVVGEREPAPGALDLERWRLVVDGLVERPLELAWSDWLLCSPEWTMESGTLRSIAERVERLEQAAATAHPSR